jgi:hypothetical protein
MRWDGDGPAKKNKEKISPARWCQDFGQRAAVRGLWPVDAKAHVRSGPFQSVLRPPVQARK